jgi:hypothetical protein
MPHQYITMGEDIYFPKPRFIEDLLFLDNKLTYTQTTRMPSYITSITAAQRLDSRGNPTVQVRLTTDKGLDSCR